MKIFFHIFFIVQFYVFSNYIEASYESNNNLRKSYNSYGQVGLIHLPSAEIKDEQSIYFTYNVSDYDKMGSLTVSPFNWLEASYFYYRPKDLYWGGPGSNLGKYLDKGFNVKFSYKPKSYLLPTIAIGLDDFAGTGQFTREYIVTTYDFEHIKLTSGFGYGKYLGGESRHRNPLSFFHETFDSRGGRSSNYDRGGNPSFDLWFRGPVAYFAGIEFFIPKTKGLSLKIESDPFNYMSLSCCGDAPSPYSVDLRKKDSNFNLGLSYPIKRYGHIDVSFVKGNTFNMSFSFGLSFNKNLKKKNSFNPVIENINHNQTKKNEFYYDLLHNLNSNNLYLQTATLDRKNLEMKIDSVDHINPIQYSSRSAYIAKKTADMNDINLDYIDIGHITRGIEINNISYKASDIAFDKKRIVLVKRNTDTEAQSSGSLTTDEFRPLLKFPIITYKFSPDIRTHIGSPAQFIYWGYGLKLVADMQLSRHLVLSGAFGKSINDNFDEKIAFADSIQPGLPRTEVVSYLQGTDEYITLLQLDHIWSPYSDIYARSSFGMFETMFGGISTEVLYKPYSSNFAFSYEFNVLKKRSYKQDLDFLKGSKAYKVKTKHLNVAYYEPSTNILLKWSYGHYLAKDKGYTLDMSRRMPSGWTAGFFYSKTNLSAEQFGEGSFDKGFYFSVPFDIFSRSYSKGHSGFKLRTMTRDGGQRIEITNKLIDSFYGSTKTEISENWNGFLR